MYLTIKQHDLFRTLLMGFEIPFRSYVSDKIITNFDTEDKFKEALIAKKDSLTVSDPSFLRQQLPKACKTENVKKIYNRFLIANKLKLRT